MKKLILAAVAASALTLTACGSGSGGYVSDGYSQNGGYTNWDWDLNNPSVYNNNTYCSGGTYNPLPNNQYTCTRNGTTTSPTVRPKQVVPPKTQQKAPVNPAAPAPKQNTVPKPAAPAPKAPAYKAPAPAPKPPAPKTGK